MDKPCQALASHWVAAQTLAMPWVGQLCPESPPPRDSHRPIRLATSQDDWGFCPQIAELETEKRDLERQVNEQKAKCEAVEKRESERRQVEEKKHNEEIQFLKRTNQQLKVIVAPAQVECPQPQFQALPAKQSSPSTLSYTDFQYCQGVKEADSWGEVRDQNADSLSFWFWRQVLFSTLNPHDSSAWLSSGFLFPFG